MWSIVVICMIVLAAGTGFYAVWNNLNHEWMVEKSAAQFAVRNGPIKTVTNHDVFTAAGAQEVFYGKGKDGTPWITFVYGNPFTEQSVQNHGYLSRTQIEHVAGRSGLVVSSAHIGYLDSAAQQDFGVQSNVIWELYAATKAGSDKYFCYDARTGKLLKSY